MMLLSRLLVVLALGLMVNSAFGETPAPAQPVVSRELAQAETLSVAGIKIGWQESLPLKTGEKIKSISALGDGMYVLTSTNYLFGLDLADGSQLFADNVAPFGLQLLPLTRRGEGILVMSGSSMRRLDAKTGAELGRINVPFGVVAVPVANEYFYYLAADDGRVYAYGVADRVQTFKAAADKGSLITNLAATNAFVIFTTNKGAIVAMEPNQPVLKWRYNTSGPIMGRITVDGFDLYVSSADTNVYKMDARTGTIIWNYMAGARLEDGPRVTPHAIYQYAGVNGMYALSKKTGNVLWQEKDGRDLLTEKDGKAYLVSASQSIIVVDNVTGKRLFEVSMPGLDTYSANVPDGVMYVGSTAIGRIACLKVAR
jgi:outer membrane protein assembly factor BamB